jgi:hypothetical protein
MHFEALETQQQNGIIWTLCVPQGTMFKILVLACGTIGRLQNLPEMGTVGKKKYVGTLP